ncbi:hypothetical protein F66182_7328 [Fusarium sp. NRRL 66182]|nr:hypothetical protein F66182_7328 [Fusarium sp. NRRL 66182]
MARDAVKLSALHLSSSSAQLSSAQLNRQPTVERARIAPAAARDLMMAFGFWLLALCLIDRDRDKVPSRLSGGRSSSSYTESRSGNTPVNKSRS